MKKLFFLLFGMLLMLLSESVCADVGTAPPDNPVIGLYQPTATVFSATIPDCVTVLPVDPPGYVYAQISSGFNLNQTAIPAYCNPDYGLYRSSTVVKLRTNTKIYRPFANTDKIRSTVRHVFLV